MCIFTLMGVNYLYIYTLCAVKGIRGVLQITIATIIKAEIEIFLNTMENAKI